MARQEQAVTVSTNHLEFRVFLLDVVYSVDLIHGVSLGGVLQKKKQTIKFSSCIRCLIFTWCKCQQTHQDDHVHPSLHQ